MNFDKLMFGKAKVQVQPLLLLPTLAQANGAFTYSERGALIKILSLISDILEIQETDFFFFNLFDYSSFFNLKLFLLFLHLIKYPFF